MLSEPALEAYTSAIATAEGKALVRAAVAEYQMWDKRPPPATTEQDAHGARSAIRGVMVRAGLYEMFVESLAQSDDE